MLNMYKVNPIRQSKFKPNYEYKKKKLLLRMFDL